MKLIPRVDGIDVDTTEHVADPSNGNISFPFGPSKNCNMSSPGSSKQSEASEPTKNLASSDAIITCSNDSPPTKAKRPVSGSP